MNNFINIARLIEEQHNQMKENLNALIKNAIGAEEDKDIVVVYYGFNNDNELEFGIYSVEEYRKDKKNFKKFRYNSKEGYTNNFLSEDQVEKVLEILPLEKKVSLAA